MYTLDSDTWVEFFSVDVAINPNHAKCVRDAQRSRGREELARHGFKDNEQFSYMNNAPEGVKEVAKKEATKLARRIEKATGVKMEVNEGMWM